MTSDLAWANSRNGWTSVLRRPEAMWIPPKPTAESEDESNEDSEQSQNSEDDDDDDDDSDDDEEDEDDEDENDDDEDQDEDEENMKSPTPQKRQTVIEEAFPPSPSQYPPGVHSWRMNAELSVPWPVYEEEEEESDDEYDFQPVLVVSEAESDEESEVGQAPIDSSPQEEFPKAVNSPVHENTSEMEIEVKEPTDINHNEAPTSSIQPRPNMSDTTESLVEKDSFDKDKFPPPPSQYPPGVHSWRMHAGPYVVLPKDHDWGSRKRVIARCNDRALYKGSVRARIKSELDSRKAESVVHVGDIQQSSAPAGTEGHNKSVINPVESAPMPGNVQGSLLPPVVKEKELSALGVSVHGVSVEAPVVDHPQQIKFKKGEFLRLYHESSGHIDAKDHLMGKCSVNEGPVTEHRPVVPPSDTVQVLFQNNNFVHPAVQLSWPPRSGTRYNCLPKKASEPDTHAPLSTSDYLPVFENQNNTMSSESKKRKLGRMNDGHENTEVKPSKKRTSKVASISARGSSFQNEIIIDDDSDDLLTPVKTAQTYSNPVAQQTHDSSTLVSSSLMSMADRDTLNINRLHQRLRLRGVFNRTIRSRVQNVLNQHNAHGSPSITGANAKNRAGSSRLLATSPSSGYVILESSADTAAPSERKNSSIKSVDTNLFGRSGLDMD